MPSLSERLEAASFALAGAGSIKDRLADAYGAHLADLEARDFPREVREEFAELIDAMHRERALPGDTVLRASLRKLSNAEASRYAMLVIRTYGRVAALKPGAGALTALPLAAGASTALPRFLVAEAGSASR